MSLAARIADRLVLKPTRNAIDPENRRRRLIETSFGTIEVWIYDHNALNESDRAVAIKFPGAGGRAEKGGPHPFDCWPDVCAEIWIVNMPGYGGSAGRAILSSIPKVAERVWEEVTKTHAGLHPLVIGNSIGCSAALFLAAHFDVGAVMLRNPVPLRELILGQHSWWNAGLFSRWLVRSLPADLDPVANARRCRAPAFFFQSAADTLVPTSYQNLVIAGYTGPKTVFKASGMDHHDTLPETHQVGYRQSLQWLSENRRR